MSELREKINEKFEQGTSNIFDNSTKWMLVPLAIIVFSVTVLGITYANTGYVVSLGIEFTGGTEVQFRAPDDVSIDMISESLEGELENLNVRQLSRGEQRWILLETQTEIESRSEIEEILLGAGIEDFEDISISTMGAAVSEGFLFEAQLAVVIAFLIMSTAIFVAFRSFVPSIAVILSAVSVIMFAMAGMNVIGINLTLGSLAALLMLIGYSVDTDIVLSTRVLKQREGSLKERIRDSIATGTTMSSGGIVAFTILLLVSTSPVLDQIAAVMIMGLAIDMPITWLGNAAILKMHDEGKI